MSNLNLAYSNPSKTMASQGTCLSGTGVFYQAMPAVGSDGRNVMKLIPVQKVNGQFVRSPTSTMKDIAEPQRDLTLDVPSISKINMSTLGPTAKGQSVNKRQFYMSTSPNPTNLTGIYHSVSIQTPIVTTKVAQSAVSLTSPELTLLNKEQLPVTVKSPALPNGQYLQIPPNAQVKTLPASALPPAIKRQIFTSSTSCASNSNLPMVLYVSPVQTMKPGGTPLCPTSQKTALSLSRLPRSSGQTLSTCSSTGSTPCSTTAKDGKRPVTPIKWVIEEADGSPAPCLVPVNSSSMTSDILKTLAEMEKGTKTCENTAKKCSPSQESQTKIGQEKDNALVMYNGKVYFVAKKTPELCNRPSKPLEASRNMGDSTTQAAESVGFNQRISLPPSLPLSASFGSQLSNKTRPDPKHIVIPDDIIDLCDDDPQDDLTCQAISTRGVTRQPEVDEDEDSNVIFVSYLPPKTVSKVVEGDKEMAYMLNDLEAEQEMLCSQDHLNGQVVDSQKKVSGLSIEKCQSIATAQDMAGFQGSATGLELNSRQQNITGQYRKILQRFHGRATGIRIENIQGNATSKEMGSSRPSASTQEMGSVQDDATDQGIGNSQHHAATQEMDNIPGSTSLQTEMETHKEKSSSDPIPEQRTSVLDMKSLETCDRLLKQMFGITSDVKICLERVDAKPKAIPKVFPRIGTTNKRTIEAIRKLLQGSNILVKRREHEVSATRNDDSCPIDAKRLKIGKVENASESSENTEPLTSPTPQLEMQPLTSPTPQLEMQPLTSPTPQLEMQPLTSPTPQLEMQPLTSPTPQLEMQPLTSLTPQLEMQPLTSPSPQLKMQPLTSLTPQLEMQPLTSPSPQLKMQPLTSLTPQLEMQPLTSPSPQLKMQPLTSLTPQLEMQPLTSPSPQLKMQPLTSPTPQLEMLSDAEHIFGYEEPTVNYLISTEIETGVPSKPLPDLNPVHISKRSSKSPVPSVHPQTNTEAMDCAPGHLCGTASNIKPNSRKRRGKGRRCTACPCGVTGTLVQDKAMSSSSTSQEGPSSSKPPNTRTSDGSTCAIAISAKQKRRKSTKAQMEDKEQTSVEIQCPSNVSEKGSSTAGEIPTSYLCSTAPMDPEEIKRHERIKRLKELLKEKEAALAMIRKNMG
ncbi:mucin-5AC isoform X2 [Coregonus clupeaformis]|uniref:mucin-5AC isoform X2 n=1 Tax=Coregonus clupeaformis TaxID=59861 RepID=UPI001BE02541|nr:mucin-5AC isoform X2 [Coregonus clupeaformis]